MTMRSTPWAAGCCGPKFMVIGLIWVSAISRFFSAFSSPGRVQHAFPGAEEIEAAEFLGQLHRLVDHALLLLVVAHLDIAGQREILAHRMPLEAVIGQDAAQIGIVGEVDAEHVPGLALEPGGGRVQIETIEGTAVVLVGRPSPARAGSW